MGRGPYHNLRLAVLPLHTLRLRQFLMLFQSFKKLNQDLFENKHITFSILGIFSNFLPNIC